MEIHIEGKMYGDSYRAFNVWKLIKGTMYGESYIGCNLWRLI